MGQSMGLNSYQIKTFKINVPLTILSTLSFYQIPSIYSFPIMWYI